MQFGSFSWATAGVVMFLVGCSGGLDFIGNDVDAGVGGSAGTGVGQDAGAVVDAGTDARAITDATVEAGADAGTTSDASVDASAGVDASVGVDAGPVVCVCDGSVAPPLACHDQCNAAFTALFSDKQLPAFYLTIFDDNVVGGSGSSWQNLIANCTQTESNIPVGPPECDHQPITFHAEYDPNPDDGVAELVTTPEISAGVHRKGRASWDPTNAKPGLKVSFTKFGGQRFMGLTRLTLNNAIQDPSMLRERVSYRVYRAAGVPAPLANNARVFIRKTATSAYEYYGVYVNVQTLDRRFVESHYAEVNGAVGNLFDTYNDVYFTELDRATCRDQAGTVAGAQESRFQLETNELVNDRSDLTALIDSVYKVGCTNGGFCAGANCCCSPTGWDQSNFVENVSVHADLTEFLRAFAVQALNTDWDGFAATRNNYKIYHDLVSNKFVVFPWGTDQSQGYQDDFYYPNWSYALNHTNSNRTRSLFMIRCEDDPTDCYAKYLAEVDSVLALYKTLPLNAEIDAWFAQIESAVLADTHKNGYYDDTMFYRNIDAVHHYVTNRAACVTRLRGGMSCASLTCPTGMTDCKTTGN
jgi:hypothetical protein